MSAAPSMKSRVERNVGHLSSQAVARWVAGLSHEEAQALIYDWSFWARPNQLAPQGDWFCWLVLAGRGFGKTRMGAEWVRLLVEGPTPLTAGSGAPARLALVGDSFADIRDVMVDGESGILACSPPSHRPVFEPSRRRLVWPNGTVAYLYSANDPDQLRGPQHHAAWADEIAKWHEGERAWSNLVLGLRLGGNPRVVATTTPRPVGWLKRLMAEPSTVTVSGSTLDNKAHLAPQFLKEVERLYSGTRLGAQELDGRLIDEIAGALWTRDLIEASRIQKTPDLHRIVVAVDPPASHGENADACGIVVAGIDDTGIVYLLDDASCQGLRPYQWAARVAERYAAFDADRVLGEANNGGDMVEAVLRQAAPDLSYRAVRASRGKIARAEPVAALYERGLVRHVGRFDALEDEMCSYTGSTGQHSPDRLDAMVWAVTELALGRPSSPHLRRL
ncbi:large terminase [Iodidimonas gelatinilytica]|uniref:Large terminase n=1 Tax=Iodidimonas gelatinilytica TaxID=1236966 RepID=A0A5A7MTX3_9PROT|nr:terminase family protein [Iodidimonas gelatinilytica]GEQ99397.1 large terminase [Iodidimonas gelatinilytica]